MTSILLHISDDEGLDARKQVALDIARAFNGHLTCLQAVNMEIFAPGDFYGSAMAAALPAIKKKAEELREKVEADLGNEGVQWDWLFEDGMAEHRLLAHSALKDLIVVGPHDIGEKRKGPSHMVGDLVIRSRTPVMVVPADQKELDCSAPAMVAWNGSNEACHALRAALPLLKRAAKVYLATVTEGADRDGYDFPPLGGATYLSRHGVECEIVELPSSDTRVSDILFSAAEIRECGFLVMGAYGRPRLAEMLLGGVTRQSLTNPKIPVLLAH
jgi:nucleotide-binding universal stress UspA family protein